MEDQLDNIKILIAEDNLTEAIDLLNAFIEDDKQLNELIIQSARINELSKDLRVGTISNEEASILKNKIRNGVLELVSIIQKKKKKGNIKRRKNLIYLLLISGILAAFSYLIKSIQLNQSVNRGNNNQLFENGKQQEKHKVNIDEKLLLEISQKLDNDEELISFWKIKYYEEKENLRMKEIILDSLLNNTSKLNLYIKDIKENIDSRGTDKKLQSDKYYRLANANLLTGQLDEAINNFYLSFSVNNANLFALKSLAVLQYRLSRFEDAKKNIEILKGILGNEVLDIYSKDSNGNLVTEDDMLINIMILQENYEEAKAKIREQFNKTIVRNQKCNYYNNLGLIADREEEFQLAIEMYSKALEIDTTINLLYNLANHYSSLKQYDLASEYFSELIHKKSITYSENSPELISVYQGVSTMYLDAEEYIQAEKYALKTLSICKEHILEPSYEYVYVYNNLGKIYSHQGRFNEAQEFIEKSILNTKKVFGKKHSMLEANYLDLSAIYFMLGKDKDYQVHIEMHSKAIDYAKKILDVNPDSEVGKQFLSFLIINFND